MSRASEEKRYLAACHAMQSGVMYEMGHPLVPGLDDSATSPKQLRVGVNFALVSNGALVALLIQKGIFTEDEYIKTQADAMETEVRLYELRANRGKSGPVLHFG